MKKMNKKELLNYYLKLHYPIKIDKDDEGDNYIAHIPELGSGAFMGVGDTVEEALEELSSIKEQYFIEHIDRGVKIPVPRKKLKKQTHSGKFILRLPNVLHAKLSSDAVDNNVSLNSFIIHLLSHSYIEEKLCSRINILDRKFDSMFFNINRIRAGVEKINVSSIQLKHIPSGYEHFMEHTFEDENLPNMKEAA